MTERHNPTGETDIDDITLSEREEQAALQEVEELVSLQTSDIPRAVRNGVIRDRLARSSDLTVAWAYTKGINVAEKELQKRFEAGNTIPLMPLLEYWHFVQPQFGNNLRIRPMIEKGTPSYASSASQGEIIRIVDRFMLVADDRFLAPILSWREDLDEIYNRMVERISNDYISGDASGIQYEIESMGFDFRRAAELREKQGR